MVRIRKNPEDTGRHGGNERDLHRGSLAIATPLARVGRSCTRLVQIDTTTPA